MKKISVFLVIFASFLVWQQPVLSQLTTSQRQMQGMVSDWQNEKDPSKKSAIAIEIQKSLGVKADGVIGPQTLCAISKMGAMPPCISGGSRRASVLWILEEANLEAKTDLPKAVFLVTYSPQDLLNRRILV